MNMTQIGQHVDELMVEMDLPPAAGLKVTRRFDEVLYPMDIEEIENEPEQERMLRWEEEREAWVEFIHSQFSKGYELLSEIETDEPKGFYVELDEMGCDTSAFNTIDFHRMHPEKFIKYHWMVDKLRETVKHLSIDFSIIKDPEVKERIREKVFDFIRTRGKSHKEMLFKIWLKYAYWD